MKLLFTAGTARGGTNFRTLLLNEHPNIRMALDPFIPLFRFYRDSLLRAAGEEHLLERLPSSVLDDYYFSDTKTRIMNVVQRGEPDITFDMARWPELKAAIASRMKLASVNLIPHLEKLPGDSFGTVFRNTMKVIAATSHKELHWVGFNDNWTAEFFPLIARLIPDARFMLHLRDPRAVVNSSEFAEPDPAKRPTVLSFARHLRKYAAFASVLPAHPDLRGRLLVTRYEPFLEDIEGQVAEMTNFLGVDFTPSMTDVGRFRNADGSPWASDWDIYRRSGGIWREEMPRDMAEVTEFVCLPEMQLHGYAAELYDASAGLSPSAYEFAVRNARDCLGWRTDFPEIERTLGGEFHRQQMLAQPDVSAEAEIERCFLFPEVFRQVLQLGRAGGQRESVGT